MSVASGVSYTSSADGLRQSRTVGAVTDQFVWDTTASIPLLLSDGPSLYIYGPALTPVAQVDASGVIQYLHTDNIGSVRLITSSTGAVVGSSDYTPYGAVAAHTGTAVSNFGFATAWVDPATKMNYLRARDYDPATGQFVQVDPVVDATHQPYAYVAGDPLASIDPSGLCVGLDGTPQDRNCTYNDYYWDGLGPSVYSSVCGTAEGWTCAVQKLDPVYWLIAGVDACSRASDVWGCGVQTFNPVYKVIDGYSREIQDTQDGCDWTVIAQDGLDAVSGVANTVALAAGAAKVGSSAIRSTNPQPPPLSTPAGHPYSAHYLTDTGPARNILGSVVDEAIQNGVANHLADRTIYYDALNNVSVVLSDITGKVMSARKGGPGK